MISGNKWHIIADSLLFFIVIYLKKSEAVLNDCNEQKLHVCHVCCLLSAVENAFAISLFNHRNGRLFFTDVS